MADPMSPVFDDMCDSHTPGSRAWPKGFVPAENLLGDSGGILFALPGSNHQKELGERLAELIPHYLVKVASCLELLVKANESGWAILDLRSAARGIVAAGLAADDGNLQRIAKHTISLLARRGYPEFWGLR